MAHILASTCPFTVTVFMQPIAESWKKINFLVCVQLMSQNTELANGVSLQLSSGTPGQNVPKKLRNLWLGIPTEVKATQKSETEIRFTFPNVNGYIGISIQFQSAANYIAFEQQLSNFGAHTVPAPNLTLSNDKSKKTTGTKASGSGEGSSGKKKASSSGGGKKRTSSDTTSNNVSTTAKKSASSGMMTSIPISNNNGNTNEEADSEVDTNPEILNITDTRGVAKTMSQTPPSLLGSFGGRDIGIDIDLNNPQVQSYIQHLLASENFNRFTDKLEQQLFP